MAEVKNICLEAIERHCASGETGRLDLQNDVYEGHIFTHQSLIVHAQLAGLEGVPALFRLFDWGDANTIWQPGITAEQPSLHLSMEAASVLYAEHQVELAELDSREKERADEALTAPETLAGQADGVTSVLKFYTIMLECSQKDLLPDGFTLTDTSKNSYVIGSSDECDVVLRHPSIDPLHCGVILEKGAVTIWDLGSHGGVKLNGAPVVNDVLKVGDVMTLGTLELHVRFQLRRPTMNRPRTVSIPNVNTGPMPKVPTTAAQKEVPKGPITYDKVAKQLKDNTKAKPFLAKLGSLFGGKDRK